MDKLAELLSGLNEVELRKAAELLQQQLKGNSTADPTDNKNKNNDSNSESICIPTEDERKQNSIEQEISKNIDSVDQQEDKQHETGENDKEENKDEDEDDEDNIPLLELHSLHMEYHKEEEEEEQLTEEEKMYQNEESSAKAAYQNNDMKSANTNDEESNTDNSPDKQSPQRSSRSAHWINGFSNNNKENELWLPARHSRRLQERAEKQAMHHENGMSENDTNNTEKENEAPRRRRSYKRKRSERENWINNNSNNNINGIKISQDGNNSEYNDEVESSSHSPSPQAHFIEMLMGCTSFRLEDDNNYNDDGSICENRHQVSTRKPGATQNFNQKDDKLIHTLSPQSPSPEAPCNEHNENNIVHINKKTFKSNKAEGRAGKRNKQSKELSAAVSNTCSLTTFGFLPTPSHSNNAFFHQNGFANTTIGDNSNNNTKADNNRLFTPFVPDHRIVPTALQFWNKDICNSNNISAHENEISTLSSPEKLNNYFVSDKNEEEEEQETNKQNELSDNVEENINTWRHEVEDNKQEDERTSLEMAAENADKYDEPSAFCLNDPDESSLMHPPLYISDGEVVIAKRTINDENEEEDVNIKSKSVSWVKSEEDEDHKAKLENKNNIKLVKFASFNAMIEASNANVEMYSKEPEEEEEEMRGNSEKEKPGYVIHNNYMNGLEQNEEEEKEINTATNSAKYIINLLSHRCPCMFHTTIPETATYKEFDNEVIFCGFYAIGYDPFQARPPYFGTYNNLQDGYLNEVELLQMARLSSAQRMPRLSNMDYEYDSGDDWDPIGKVEDLADDESEISEIADEYESCSDSGSYSSVAELLSEREKEEYEWEEEQLLKHDWLPSTGHDKEEIKKHNHKHKHRRYKDSEQNKLFIDDTYNESDEDSDCELQRKIMEAREKRINRLRKKDRLIPAFSGPFISLTAEEHPLALFDSMQFVSFPQCRKAKENSENNNEGVHKLNMTEFFDNIVKEEAFKMDTNLLLTDEERSLLSNKQHQHQHHEQKLEVSKEEQEELEKKQKGKEKRRQEKLAKIEEAKEAKRLLREERRATLAARLAQRALNKKQQAMNEEEINAMHACVEEHQNRVNTRIIIASLLAQNLCKNVTNMEIARTVKRFYEKSHGMLVQRDEPWAPYDERLFTHEKKHKKKNSTNTENNINDSEQQNEQEEEMEEEEKRNSGRKSDELTVEELFALSEKHHQQQEQQKFENEEGNDNISTNKASTEIAVSANAEFANDMQQHKEEEQGNERCNELEEKNEELLKPKEINNVSESVSEHSVVQIEETTDTSTESENKSRSSNISTSKSDDISDKDVKEIRYSQSVHKRPREDENDVTLQFITVHTSDSEPQTVIIEDNTQLSKEESKTV